MTTALILGHPGHELRLHHWIGIAKPLVFVLTGDSSRIAATIEILQRRGGVPAIMGAFTDREIYRLLLGGDVDPIAAITLEIAESLVAHDVRSVVTDGLEWYNPTHDLCSVVAGLAVERTRRAIARYEYAVTEAPSGDGEVFALDDVALEKKLADAHACDDLRREVESLIERIGIDALRTEILRPVAHAQREPRAKPFYETHGERRVASGRYDTVIRYEQHFRPFVEKLTTAVHSAPLAVCAS